jgi:hypothetical protein
MERYSDAGVSLVADSARIKTDSLQSRSHIC